MLPLPAQAAESPVTLSQRWSTVASDGDEVLTASFYDYDVDPSVRTALDAEFAAFGLSTDWITEDARAPAWTCAGVGLVAPFVGFEAPFAGHLVQQVGAVATLPDGSEVCPSTRYRYDGRGQLVSVSDAHTGAESTLEYAYGRLASVTLSADAPALPPVAVAAEVESVAAHCAPGYRERSVFIARDEHGRVYEVTDSSGGRYEHRYDGLGRAVARSDHDGTTTWEYNHLGVSFRERRWDTTNADAAVAGTTVQVAESATFYDSYGNIVGTCMERQAGGCDGDLASLLVADHESPREMTIAPWRSLTHREVSPDGRPLAVRDPEAAVTEFVYDGLARPIVETRYPGAGLLVEQEMVRTFDYEDADTPRFISPGPTTVRTLDLGDDSRSLTMHQYFDRLGRAVADVDANGVTTIRQFTQAGALSAELTIGADGLVYDVARFEHAGGTYPTRVTEALLDGPSPSVTFDMTGLSTVESSLEYDRSARVTAMHLPAQPAIEIGYLPTGQVAWQSDGQVASGVCYDGDNTVAQAWSVGIGAPDSASEVYAGLQSESALDPHGRPVQVTYDPHGEAFSETLRYGPLGRLEWRQRSTGNRYEYFYDRAGDLTTEKVSNAGSDARVQTFGRDRLGFATRVYDFNGEARELHFDGLHRLVARHEPGAVGPTTEFEARSYDAVGRLASTSNDVAAYAYAYDNGGTWPTASTSHFDTTVWESRDGLGRPKSVTRDLGGDFTRVLRYYDPSGQLEEESLFIGSGSAPVWTVGHARDAHGRLTATDVDSGYRIARAWGDGFVANYDFNIGATFSVTQTIEGGLRSGTLTALPDGAVDTLTVFDPLGRAAYSDVMRVGAAGDEPLARSRQRYDGMGRVTERWSGTADAAGDIFGLGRRYTYASNAEWLAEIRGTAGVVAELASPQAWGAASVEATLARTPNGSLLREVDDGVPVFELTRPGSRNATAATALTGTSASLDWDPAGRLKTDGAFTHHWSGRGEWLGATVSGSSSAPSRSVVRDAFGRAVRTVYEGGGATVSVDHVFVGANVVEDRYHEGGTLCLRRTTHYGDALDDTHGHSLERFDDCARALELAGIDPAELLVGELRSFAHLRDLAGHVVAVTDEEGAVVERFQYAEHGETLDADTGAAVGCGLTCGTSVGTPTGYRGMRRLGLSDAYDARHRVYDASMRQFWSKDPLGWVDGYDRWAYVGGDPVNYLDPWGLSGAPDRVQAQPAPYRPPYRSIEPYEPHCGLGACLLAGGRGARFGEPPTFQLEEQTRIDIVGSAIESYSTQGTGGSGPLLPRPRPPRAATAATTSGSSGPFAGSAAASATRTAEPGSRGPDFVVTSRGTTHSVPPGATGPVQVVNPGGRPTGFAFTGGRGGANGQVDTVRFMDPTPARGSSPGYPAGYVKYENSHGQGVDPISGRTGTRASTHFPMD